MSDREHARTLLAIGRRDLKALRGMSDSTIFDDEVFGFHAQQAVEKALKSWLSLLGVRYPRIHDLEELSATLESSGADAERRVTGLLGLTDFAVQMRYEAGDVRHITATRSAGFAACSSSGSACAGARPALRRVPSSPASRNFTGSSPGNS